MYIHCAYRYTLYVVRMCTCVCLCGCVLLVCVYNYDSCTCQCAELERLVSQLQQEKADVTTQYTYMSTPLYTCNVQVHVHVRIHWYVHWICMYVHWICMYVYMYRANYNSLTTDICQVNVSVCQVSSVADICIHVHVRSYNWPCVYTYCTTGMQRVSATVSVRRRPICRRQ